jgi:hypothetical protein
LLKQKDKFEIDLRQFRQQIDEHIDEVESNIRDHFSDMYNKEVEVVKQRETGVTFNEQTWRILKNLA